MLNRLAALLGGGQQAPNPNTLGSGMASQAASILQSRPYQLHVQEARANGQQPLTPEQFLIMMQQR